MLGQIKKLLGLDESEDKAIDFDPVALGCAALLLEVAHVDGQADAVELEQLRQSLLDHFVLDHETILKLEEKARSARADAVDLYAFTRPLAAALDQDERQEIVRLMWRIALSDQVIDNFEANLLAKVAGLLGVHPSDRVRLRQEVEAED